MADEKWVIIEVDEVNGQAVPTAYPNRLVLEPAFTGQIIWYVFTPGWELSPTDGVNLRGTPYDGLVAPDPDRPGCWTATVLNSPEDAGVFNYSLFFRRIGELTEYEHDPVIENDPPPTPSVREDIVRKKRQRRVAAAANH